MSDLAIWLWTMLATAPAKRAYNVGSDESVSIAELARIASTTLSSRPDPEQVEGAVEKPAAQSYDQTVAIQIDGTPSPGAPPVTYVPDIARAQTELGLRVTVPLTEAIRKTATWYT
jgi:dTDP-glucose 4,6-dehydratase